MKRKTNKTKEEAWSQTAHAPDGEQPGPEASDTSGQSVPKSKFRKKSQQEQAAAEKARPGKTHRPCCQRFRSQLRAWQDF